jgi:hypothetical protein
MNIFTNNTTLLTLCHSNMFQPSRDVNSVDRRDIFYFRAQKTESVVTQLVF